MPVARDDGAAAREHSKEELADVDAKIAAIRRRTAEIQAESAAKEKAESTAKQQELQEAGAKTPTEADAPEDCDSWSSTSDIDAEGQSKRDLASPVRAACVATEKIAKARATTAGGKVLNTGCE